MCGGNPEETTHYRSKTVKSRIFFPLMFVVSHILKIFIRFYKSFSVCPALVTEVEGERLTLITAAQGEVTTIKHLTFTLAA